MGGIEDVRPFTPAADRLSSDGEDGQHSSFKKHILRRRCVLCGAFCLITKVFVGVLILILILTVFKIKEPEIRLNSVIIKNLSINNLTRAVNMSAMADVSVKNPNAITFMFDNSTSSVMYHGRTVGDAINPAGRARARRTMRLNVSLVILADRIIRDRDLANDMATDIMPVTTYTRLGGKVNILHLIKKHVDVTLNCSLNISVSTQKILSQNCEHKMKI